MKDAKGAAKYIGRYLARLAIAEYRIVNNEDIKLLIFKCLECGEEDEVPEYVVEEFHFDLRENEEVEVVCLFVMARCEE
jgi:hypothetical protein